MKMGGGNNKIAPPNRFALLKTFSCNRQFEKPQTPFLKKSLVLGRKWLFWGGESIEGAPKMAIPEARSKMSKSRIQCMPKL